MSSKRNCCAPIVPVTTKAKTLNTGLAVITACHFIVLFIKCYLMGVFAGLTDLIALVILIVALVRYDYCLTITYVIFNLFEIFSLVVVLGYYLQTDMGRKAPHDAVTDDDQQEAMAKKDKKHGIASKNEMHGITIMFRGIFDKLLKLRYGFYQQSIGTDQIANASLVGIDQSLNNQIQEGAQILAQSEGEPPKLAHQHGPVFIICFCSGLILFYIVASIVAHCVYREWKGLAEDCAGGSIDGTDRNFLFYAVIAKREEDAIEERAELAKKKRDREARLKEMDNQGDQAPLMENNA